MLHRALIGLDAGKLQTGGRVNRLGDFHNFRRGGHTAAARAAVDFDQALDLGPVLLRPCRQIGHIGQIIDTADRPRAQFRHARQTVDLGRVAHLVRHQHVFDTATSEHFGLRHFLAADAASAAQFHLQLGHINGFVHLAMYPVAHAVGLGIIAHFLDVPLQRIEVEDQRRRLNIGLIHAGKGGDVEAHFVLVEVGQVFHNIAPISSGCGGLAPTLRGLCRVGVNPPSKAISPDPHCRR